MRSIRVVTVQTFLCLSLLHNSVPPPCLLKGTEIRLSLGCPLVSDPTTPLSMIFPEDPSPLSYTEATPVPPCYNPASPPRPEVGPAALVSEATTGLGGARGGHFLPTIVFQTGPHRDSPVVVPGPPVVQRSMSVGSPAAILGLYP